MFLTVFGSLDSEARKLLQARVRADPGFGHQAPPVLAHATEAASTLASLRFAAAPPSTPSPTSFANAHLSVAPSPLSPSISPPSVDVEPIAGVSSSNMQPGPADVVPAIVKPRKAISVKHYADAIPSKHCHVCCRSAKNVEVYPCARIKEGVCRKVVCVRCFAENGWVYEPGWTCCHCRGVCPKRGQCYTYGRSNMRRRQQTIRKQMELAAEKQKQQLHQLPIPPMAP